MTRITPCVLTAFGFRIAWLLSLSYISLALPTANAQHSGQPDIPHSSVPLSFRQGTHAFRRVMHDAELEPIGEADELWSQPANTILIVLGDVEGGLRKVVKNDEKLRQFLRDGGSLLVATDHHTEGVLWNAVGVGIDGTFLEVDEASGYRHLTDFPFVQPVRSFDPPLFKGLTRIAANRPSYIKINGWRTFLPRRGPKTELRLLAELHSLRTVPRDASEKPVSKDQWPFAYGGDYGSGRVLVLADHSIFINDMMLQKDNDNTQFAYNCVEWLAGPDGQRKQVLFIEDGVVRTDFDLPLLPVPSFSMTILGNILAHELDKDQRLDRIILESIPGDQVLPIVLYVSTLLLLGCGLLWMSRVWYRPVAAASPLVLALARSRRQGLWSNNGSLHSCRVAICWSLPVPWPGTCSSQPTASGFPLTSTNALRCSVCLCPTGPKR